MLAKIVRFFRQIDEFPAVRVRLSGDTRPDVGERELAAEIVGSVGDDGENNALRTFVFLKVFEFFAKSVDREAEGIAKRRPARVFAIERALKVVPGNLVQIEVVRRLTTIFRELIEIDERQRAKLVSKTAQELV